MYWNGHKVIGAILWGTVVVVFTTASGVVMFCLGKKYQKKKYTKREKDAKRLA